MERSRSHPQLEPSEIRRRMRSIAAGLWLTASAVAVAVGYVALTWDRPHRSALAALLVGVIVGSIGLWLLPRRRIVCGRHWIWFFLAWTGADIGFVLALAALDGGAESPLALVLVLPLIYAASFYPMRPIVAVGVVTVAGYLALALAGRSDPAYAVLVAGLLGQAAWLCGWQTKIGERQRAELQRVSRADSLTGCLNRRGFEERLDAALDAAVRGGRPLALVLVDLDDFKAINDRHGHAAGDDLLCWAVGRSVRRCSRWTRSAGSAATSSPCCSPGPARVTPTRCVRGCRRASPSGSRARPGWPASRPTAPTARS
jgi:hypothetical protein